MEQQYNSFGFAKDQEVMTALPQAILHELGSAESEVATDSLHVLVPADTRVPARHHVAEALRMLTEMGMVRVDENGYVAQQTDSSIE
jgi:hypothetical protein